MQQKLQIIFIYFNNTMILLNFIPFAAEWSVLAQPAHYSCPYEQVHIFSIENNRNTLAIQITEPEQSLTKQLLLEVK